MLRRSLSISARRSMTTSSSSAAPAAAAAPLSAVHTSETTPAWSDWRMNPSTATPVDSIMFREQSKLPRLPVPSLQSTLSRVIKSCEPLALNATELDALKRKVVEFESGLGPILQRRLDQRRETPGMRNWIAQWWEEKAYMEYRDSIVVNVSYYYGFSRLPQSPQGHATTGGKSDPAYVAASIVSTALEFRRMIAQGLLEPEQVGKPGEGELCMESFKWCVLFLLGSERRYPNLSSDFEIFLQGI